MTTSGRGYSAPVRWREDVGWELRCERCAAKREACFWPLTDEFWNKGRMGMCRACERERQRVRKFLRYHDDEAFRRATVAKVMAWRKENEFKVRMWRKAQWEAIKADPQRHAAIKRRHLMVESAYRARRKVA